MYSNEENPSNGALIPRRNQKKMTWKDLVGEQISQGRLIGTTCAIYSRNMEDTVDEQTRCVCGRLARRHSFTGQPMTNFWHAQKWLPEFARTLAVTEYGRLDNDARYLRCQPKDDTFETLVQLIVADVSAKPKLLISCYGGAEYFTMTDQLEREFMSGISEVAATKDVWILTTGLNSGVSKLIGKGVHRNTLLNENPWKPVVIGMSSWGTISGHTRQMLKQQTSSNKSTTSDHARTALLDINPTKTLDRYHTHFLLLDLGCFNHYLDDRPRSRFVQATCDLTQCHAITIIVEGGVNTVEVIQHDLRAYRPVVIIHGSGRLASVLGNLLENAGKTGLVGDEEIEQQLKSFPALYSSIESERKRVIGNIKEILDIKYRPYFSVFQLSHDVSLTNTIFRAVFDTETTNTTNSEKLLELAVSWNCISGAYDLFKRIQISHITSVNNIGQNAVRKYYPGLFEKALKENRPLFVDYFLRHYYNPLETTAFVNYRDNDTNTKRTGANNAKDDEKICVGYALRFIVEILYRNAGKAPIENCSSPKTLGELDQTCQKLIGPYAESFYTSKDTFERIHKEFFLLFGHLNWTRQNIIQVESDADTLNEIVMGTQPSTLLDLTVRYHCQKPYGKQEMLRDIFLWSVYEGYIDIAFVLLLQLKSRISAALVATGVSLRLASMSRNPHIRNTYKEHQRVFEEYATACIDACYKHNKRYACQLLLREIPLFGNITCMQAAIRSRSIPFINTNCFNQVLDQEWHGYLDSVVTRSIGHNCKFFFHLLSFGVFAPRFLDYRATYEMTEKKKPDDGARNKKDAHLHNQTSPREFLGIDDQSNEEAGYMRKWIQFHKSPVVMVSYHLLIYLWFLLVFSYLMLFHMKYSSQRVHWSEIYVIITVSATLLEDIRKAIVEFHTRMLERWHKEELWLLSLYLTPYLLFYIGIGLHFASRTHPELFTAARIVLALDLEIWYLFSLRFLSVSKLLGPKLFMIRNMMRDLISIIFIILLCNAAYGVVSRALTMYSNIQFTTSSILIIVFYRPYWFLYSIIDDEKNYLEKIIFSDTSLSSEKTEATVQCILLIFHMLFVGILMLNLLIALFNFSIEDVQEKNTYFWHYQRYELICEYFEKPMFAYPPLSLLIYVWLLIKFVLGRRPLFQIFKRLVTPKLDDEWTDFENAATYEYARALVEEKYRSHSTNQNVPPEPESEEEEEVPSQIQIKMQETINELQDQNKQILAGMERMMEAINRLKTSVEPSVNSDQEQAQ